MVFEICSTISGRNRVSPSGGTPLNCCSLKVRPKPWPGGGPVLGGPPPVPPPPPDWLPPRALPGVPPPPCGLRLINVGGAVPAFGSFGRETTCCGGGGGVMIGLAGLSDGGGDSY